MATATGCFTGKAGWILATALSLTAWEAIGQTGSTPKAAEAAKPASEVGGGKAEAKPTDAKAKPADAKAAADLKAADVKANETAKALGPIVEMKTSEGTIVIELDEKAAPVTVKNFLSYVNEKFYDGVIFHRVIDGFMIQGGGFVTEGDKLTEKKYKASIINEAKNGLKNDKGTIAMARTSDPNSASAQFFINLVNNDGLNYPKPDGHGYAVFGKVTSGLDVVEKIGKVKTGFKGGMADVPVSDVKIISATVSTGKAH